jgi:hypothetical protein
MFTIYVFGGISAPTLLSPGDGFVSPSAIIDFDWADVADTLHYLFQLSHNIGFTNLALADSNVAVSHYRNGQALANGEYYWRVKASDGVHWSPFSEIWTITINADTSFIVGDANGSGNLNGVDIVYMVNYLKGGEPPVPYLAGDVNGSCDVNGLDVIFLVNFFKGGAYPFRGNCLTQANQDRRSADDLK